MIIYAIVIAVLIKLLLATENPLLCAGFAAGFAAVSAGLGVFSGHTTVFWALAAVLLTFLCSLAYFWVLDRMKTGSFEWWIVLLAGALAGFFL